MWLSPEAFRTIVATTPLVSIDLVVQNSQGEVLLGQRLNRPAQGYWFVPGGRILKNETLDDAFRRLTRTELGQTFERSQARLLDVYEHFYDDFMFGEAGAHPGTHYVVLGYQLKLSATAQLAPPAIQHDRYQWWSKERMSADRQVHANSRAYLQTLD